MPRVDAFLKLGSAQGCSDIHLAVGVPPMLRMSGELMPIRFRDLADAELSGYLAEIMTKTQAELFNSGKDLDFSYVSEEGGAFASISFAKKPALALCFAPFQTPCLRLKA